MMLLLGSCANDITQGGTGTDSGSETLKIAFNIAQPKTVDDGNAVKATRSMTTAQESVVNSISIVVFNTTGDKVGECYSTFSSAKTTTFYASVPVAVANSYKVYAVANASSTAIASMKAATTLTAFNAISETLSSADDLNSATSLVMFGKGTATLGNSNGVGSTTSISLSRLAAKITLNLTSSNNFTITSYQVCHTAMSSFASSDNGTAYVSGTNYNPLNTYKNQTVVRNLSTTSISPVVYMYENLSGSSSMSTAPALRNSTNAPSTAVFLLIHAQSSSTGLAYEYRYYLGGASSSDFTNYNIQRNINYTYNININGGDVADSRVTNIPKPGDYLYSTGKWGTTTSGGTVIGIISSNVVSDAEYAKGYTHGCALALNDASVKTTFRTSDTEALLPKVTTIAGQFNDIFSGYYGTHNLNYGATTEFLAWKFAREYNVNVTGFTNSGWYLPSIGQWWDVCANLGGMNLSSLQALTTTSSSLALCLNSTATTNANNKIVAAGGSFFTNGNWYWSASEYDEKNMLIFSFLTNYSGISINNMTFDGYGVRSFITF